MKVSSCIKKIYIYKNNCFNEAVAYLNDSCSRQYMTKPYNLLVHDTPSRLHDRELLLPVGLNMLALFVAVKHLKGTNVLNKRLVWRVEEIKIKSWTWKLCFEKPRWFCIDFKMASTSDDWQVRMPNASSNVTAGPASIVRSSGLMFFLGRREYAVFHVPNI